MAAQIRNHSAQKVEVEDNLAIHGAECQSCLRKKNIYILNSAMTKGIPCGNESDLKVGSSGLAIFREISCRVNNKLQRPNRYQNCHYQVKYN